MYELVHLIKKRLPTGYGFYSFCLVLASTVWTYLSLSTLSKANQQVKYEGS